MRVGLVRSLHPPDILWIRWRVYNSIANTSKGGTLLPPSDAYVRSFLYLLYTLIKLYYTKSLSDPASSLALDWICLLQRPRIPHLIVQQQPFTGKSGHNIQVHKHAVDFFLSLCLSLSYVYTQVHTDIDRYTQRGKHACMHMHRYIHTEP